MPGELDELYRQTLKRIRKQAGDDGVLGMRILSWLAHARRPLSVDELRHGLAVEFNNDDDDDNEVMPEQLDEDNLLSPGSLVDVCAGLVIIDSTSQIIRLVHYTTQEFFDKSRLDIFKDADLDISRACLTYLSYNIFSKPPIPQVAWKALQSYPFLNYASRYWFLHAKSGLRAENPDPTLLKAVAGFETSASYKTSSFLVSMAKVEWFLEHAFDINRKDLAANLIEIGTDVHDGNWGLRPAAVKYDNSNLVGSLLKNPVSFNIRGLDGQMHCHFAVYHDNLIVVDVLPDGDTDSSAKNKTAEIARKFLFWDRKSVDITSPEMRMTTQHLLERLRQLEQLPSAPATKWFLLPNDV